MAPQKRRNYIPVLGRFQGLIIQSSESMNNPTCDFGNFVSTAINVAQHITLSKRKHAILRKVCKG